MFARAQLMLSLLLCLLCLSAAGALKALAAASAASEEPISIEADRMVSLENKETVIFNGKVEARQGKVTIRSDEMTVFYTKEQDNQQERVISQVEKLICKGDVKVTQEDWLGTGDRMDYFAGERKVVLSGNAKAWQGRNMVAGKTITYYLDEKRSVVEQDPGVKGRVRATLHPAPGKHP